MTRARRLLSLGPLLLGVGLLALTLFRADLQSIGALTRQLGMFLPVILVPGALWHVLRTIAWHQCFDRDQRPPFGRAWRVRLAAEAFSFVTIRGVAGEPLKVVLLEPHVPAAMSAAAVALERIAYMVVTAVIVGISAIVAMITMPLTRVWIEIFAVVAAAAAAMVGVTIAFWVRAARSGASTGASPQSLWGSQFLRALEAQLRHLVRTDRGRLQRLAALEAAAYLTMALEVWAVLWVTGTPLGFGAAMAIETFTRAASVASAFIPGNVGALEASNVAVAAALHAAGAAAALALARRVRGVLWCVAGFLIYPRPSERESTRRMTSPSSAPRGTTLALIEDAESDLVVSDHLGGLPVGERILRSARRAGYQRVLVWAPRQSLSWERLARRLGRSLDFTATSDAARWCVHLTSLDPASPITVVAPGMCPAPLVLEAARDLAPVDPHVFVTAIADSGLPSTGVFRALPECLSAPAAIATQLTQAARRKSVGRDPAQLSLRISRRDELPAAERRLRESIVKPTDGVLGRFNRRLSIPLSVALIRSTRLNAHVMSVLLIVLGFYAGWLFNRGDYMAGVFAALVSLAASILDGCDGELARLQYKESAFGCWLDTFGDYTYYLAIFTGLTIGMVRYTGWTGFWWVGGALLAGCLITFALLIFLRGRITEGRPERLRSAASEHFASGKSWTRIAKELSTVATRATMPYGIVVLAVFDLLPALLILAAVGAQVYWISLAIELRRLLRPQSYVRGQPRVPATGDTRGY
jgi:phosphatidylglycerophosphate synthase